MIEQLVAVGEEIGRQILKNVSYGIVGALTVQRVGQAVVIYVLVLGVIGDPVFEEGQVCRELQRTFVLKIIRIVIVENVVVDKRPQGSCFEFYFLNSNRNVSRQ